MNKLKLLLFFLIIVLQGLAQQPKHFEIKITNDSSSQLIDTNTIFTVFVKNISKDKKLKIPDSSNSEICFGGYSSFFHVFVYSMDSTIDKNTRFEKDQRLIHPVPNLEILKKERLKKSLIRIKSNSTKKYQLALLKRFELPKGKYYLRLQFITPFEVAKAYGFYYDIHSEKYYFEIK
jgi:hypothetical protein